MNTDTLDRIKDILYSWPVVFLLNGAIVFLAWLIFS